jgi:hypothetical protein
MNRRVSLSILLASLLALMFISSHRANATIRPASAPQGQASPADAHLLARGLSQDSDGLWFTTDDERPILQAVPQSSGGPDTFGYTWNDFVPFNWINTSGGLDTGISNVTASSGPISIGFPFRFYENSYTQLYVSRNGFLAFNNQYLTRTQSRVPSPGLPNNVIAPYWNPISFVNGYVRTLQGGSAPNRWFVVEWNRVQQSYGHEFTFQAVLHENGNIVYQYAAMNYVTGQPRSCEDVGIEDSEGLDGFSIHGFCYPLSSNRATRINRPAPAARVKVLVPHQGLFSHAGATEEFQVRIRNTGELGNDTYDLLLDSTVWPVSLFAADGMTPLVDSNGNGIVDTGSLAQGQIATIVARVATPAGATLGQHNMAAITVRSSLDTSKSRQAVLRTAVPTQFAQVYQDAADGAMGLYLVQPQAQAHKKASPDNQYGSDLAVAETGNGNFVYAWTRFRWVGNNTYREIEYILLDRTGTPLHPVRRLANLAGNPVSTYELQPAVASLPDGRTGILWSRYQWNSATSQVNYNIYFAILDAAGNLIHGPSNITNNHSWGDWSALHVPRYSSPRLAVSGDNRFALAWQQSHLGNPAGSCTSFCYVDDVYVAVRGSSGEPVTGAIKVTHDTPGWEDAYYSPVLAPSAGNHLLLAFARSGNVSDIFYIVLDSNGQTVKPMANLSLTGSNLYAFSPAATRLANGNILVGWTLYGGWQNPTYNIQYALLASDYSLVAGPQMLVNPAAVTGSSALSATADNAGRAILTWTDNDWDYRRNLYYALIASNGAQVTPPMVMHSSKASLPYLTTSYHTYGNTPYSWTPPQTDGAIFTGTPLAGAAPGGAAVIPVRYSSHGTSVATGVTITATLSSSLSYAGDSSGASPNVSGNNVTWNLPNMAFLDENHFMLYLNIPADAGYGTRYPVTLTIAVAGADANMANNSVTLEVMAAHQLFLPTAVAD